ncbi:MAG: hypothetical protein D6725_09625 [Planctomycetota bacterium]|nr:MAG: hypothetical protein D6725_09625 [Planctomycetota bacterium]
MALAERGDVVSPRGLAQHLELCPQCAAYRDALRRSLNVLRQHARRTALVLEGEHDPQRARRLVEETLKSLWRRSEWSQPVFNAWIPLGAAVAIAFTAVLVIPLLTPSGTPIRVESAGEVRGRSDRFEHVFLDPSWKRLHSENTARYDLPVHEGSIVAPTGNGRPPAESTSWLRDGAPQPWGHAASPAKLESPPSSGSPAFIVPARQRSTDFTDF